MTVIAPRHPPRGPSIAEIATVAGLKPALRSRGELPEADIDVYIADTLGELGLIYRLAPIVFMGGSLTSHGGQNPIEAVKLGAAVLHGPHVWNFAEIYAALDKTHGAELVADEEALTDHLAVWLAKPASRAVVAQAAIATVGKLGGALERTLAAIEPYLLQLRLEQRASVMREPAFWWQPGRGGLLRPLAGIYGAVAARRMNSPGRSVGVPVICLGNLTVGGAGKTPAALAVARLLLAAHAQPYFLSRGYGGRLRGPVRVDAAVHSAAEVGDEPLLLARLAPTIVARDRFEGAQSARVSGAGVIVMDDGFQNPSLVKDLAILVVDGRRGIGNGRIIPAGPLRAPLDAQVAHAQAMIIVGPPAGAAAAIEPRAVTTPPSSTHGWSRIRRRSPRSANAGCWPSPASATRKSSSPRSPAPVSPSPSAWAFPTIIATRPPRRRR